MLHGGQTLRDGGMRGHAAAILYLYRLHQEYKRLIAYENFYLQPKAERGTPLALSELCRARRAAP